MKIILLNTLLLLDKKGYLYNPPTWLNVMCAVILALLVLFIIYLLFFKKGMYMNCKRCGKEFCITTAMYNVESYGEPVIVACPHCGKAHLVRRKVQFLVDEVPDGELGTRKTDDWGDEIVTDKTYNKEEKQ